MSQSLGNNQCLINLTFFSIICYHFYPFLPPSPFLSPTPFFISLFLILVHTHMHTYIHWQSFTQFCSPSQILTALFLTLVYSPDYLYKKELLNKMSTCLACYISVEVRFKTVARSLSLTLDESRWRHTS